MHVHHTSVPIQGEVEFVADEDFEESDLSDIEDFEQESEDESEEEKEKETVETFKKRAVGKKGKVEIEYELENEPKKRLKHSR